MSNGSVIATHRWRAVGAFSLILFGGSISCFRVYAQSILANSEASFSASAGASSAAGAEGLPDAPGQSGVGEQAGREISGTVTDASGAVVAGAQVTLVNRDTKAGRTLATDGDGHFSFDDTEPGTYRITITSAGFMPWVSPEIVLRAGQSYDVPRIVMQVAVANTNVEVVLTQHDIAEEQLKGQEKQRVLGVFPNFWVSYVWDAAPLSVGQKFQLAWRSSIDPVSFLGAAFGAGLEQWHDNYPGYGEGAKGYFTRMGASYGDGFNSSMIAGAILPSLFHQDPRYFYKGTGTVRQRALYAMSAVVMCRGDNGKWEPNYSNVLGNFASGGLSNAYYPAGSRGVRLTLVNATLGTAAGAIGNLIQEFVIKKISTGVKQQPATTQQQP
jgi:Carboxypeptidase regulatory-like domain